MAKTKTTKKPETKKAAPKRAAEKKTPASEVVAKDREMVLGLLKDAGLSVEKKAAWIKVLGKERRRVYVANRGPQVDLAGFTVKGHNVEQLSEAEAKKRHIGSVRGIVHLDRNTSEALKALFRDVVAEMR